MKIGVPKESLAGEFRVALIPDAVRGLVGDAVEVLVERGAGEPAGYPDAFYEKAGAQLADRARVLAESDVLTAVHADPDHLEGFPSGRVLIGLLRPLDRPGWARALAERGITSFAMELMPRITRAQSMDALSSQSNLAGYRAVLVAAAALAKALPMMVTAAGTISPARVLVLGAGVAGLQAIATAKRLGAVVEAYDVRPAVKEQVESLGGRFLELELETAGAEDAGGYAKAQSEEFLAKQRELLSQRVAAADVVITTALVPGRPAPRLVEEEAVRAMKPGSVVVDMAAESGGNCSLTRPDEVVEVEGVRVFGPTNLPSEVAFHASQTYARNVSAFLKHLMPEGALKVDRDDEITDGALLTFEGAVVDERVKALLDPGAA